MLSGISGEAVEEQSIGRPKPISATRAEGSAMLAAVQILRFLCVLAALIGIVIAIFATPAFVAGNLSPDGEINQGTVFGINAIRGVCALLAVALLVLATRPRWIQIALRTALIGNTGILPWAIFATVLVVVLIALGYLVTATTGTPITNLLRDPNAIADLPFYFGALEYAGIVVMAAAGGIALFSATLTRGPAARFLLLGGLLTLLLVCDDLYMLHENSWHFYLNEKTTFALYGLFALLFVLTNLTTLLYSSFLLFVTAGLFFAAAIAADSSALPGFNALLPSGSEDMLELIGICFWATYFVKCSRDALRAR